LLAVHVGKHFGAPPIVQSPNPLLEFAYSGNGIFVLFRDFESIVELGELCIEVDRQYIPDRDRFEVLGLALGRVFRRDIVLQLLLRGRNFI
jgi:hypothetical protein